MRMIRRVISVCLVLWACIAHAQDVSTWTLTTADFSQQTVMPVSLDDQALTARTQPAETLRTIPLTQFLELQLNRRPPDAPAGPWVLYLHNGDRLSGEAGQTRQDRLTWLSPVVGELDYPLREIGEIRRAGGHGPDQADTGPDDVVHLANGDMLRGIITSINAGRLTLQPAAGDAATVSLESVTRITFAATQPPRSSDAPAFRLRFSEGSSLVVPSVRLDGGRVRVRLPGDQKRDVPLNLVTAIEQINGPVVWLSSLTPKEDIQIPFLSIAHPARPDRNVFGGPIRFGGQTYARGIGVHAYSRLVYEIGGGFAAFRARYAIDTSESDGRYADVTVRIRLDGRVVFEQEHFKAGILAPTVQLPLDGASTLTLEVDYGQNMDVQDRFNWIEAALLRHLAPASQPAQP